MIKVKLSGGLGNQMFQYALARHLAYNHHTKLKAYFEKNNPGDTVREYNLGCFNLFPGFSVSIYGYKFSRLMRILKKIFGESKRLFKEKSFRYDPEVFSASHNSILEGYWQSEKYFRDIEEIIKDDFKFKSLLDGKNLKVSKEIESTNSISIHIRRGDYVLDKKTNEYHGVCGLDYYDNAISHINKYVHQPNYFVFSDDIEWVKSNLRVGSKAAFIDWNKSDRDYIDMQLISLCKHNIIANSSFSWWGAWLNNNPKKIIIAPKRWFKDRSMDSTDLIPSSWIKL